MRAACAVKGVRTRRIPRIPTIGIFLSTQLAPTSPVRSTPVPVDFDQINHLMKRGVLIVPGLRMLLRQL